jgi:metal-responsive CopG/Arc/MetJ family transcriptional regulator
MSRVKTDKSPRKTENIVQIHLNQPSLDKIDLMIEKKNASTRKEAVNIAIMDYKIK